MQPRNAIARCKRHQETARVTLWQSGANQLFTEPRTDFDTLLDRYDFRATACGCRNTVGLIDGTLDPNRPCTRTCKNAYGLSCRCSCGGAEHGSAHSIEVLQALRQ